MGYLSILSKEYFEFESDSYPFHGIIDKRSATSSATPPSPNVLVPRPSFNSLRCTPTRALRRLRTDVWQEGLRGVFPGISELQG